MPANRNVKGGKGYKKGKKGNSGGGERESAFESRGEGQDYGRVVRLLGNRRVAIYCNDGVERNCKIRGAMCRGPKKQILNVGDIVLFSLRTFDDRDAGSDSDEESGPVGITGGGDGGDIILKYESNQWRQLRKEDGVNPALFIAGTTAPATTDANVGQSVVDIFKSDAAAANRVEGEERGDDSRISHFTDTAATEEFDIDLI